MRAPRTGDQKRIERAFAIEAAKTLDAAWDRAYYEEYPLNENAARHRAFEKAQAEFVNLAIVYFLGAKQASVAARLKRRAARRKAAAAKVAA